MKPFFKRLLEHTLFTFITLMIFFLCFMLSIKVWELFEDRHFYSDPPQEDFDYTDSHEEMSKDLQLHSIQTEPNTESLTITGRIQNNSSTLWQGVSLDVIYYVEDIEMGRCDSFQIEEINPKGTYHFSSICPLSTHKLPSQFSYKVFFSYGRRQAVKTI